MIFNEVFFWLNFDPNRHKGRHMHLNIGNGYRVKTLWEINRSAYNACIQYAIKPKRKKQTIRTENSVANLSLNWNLWIMTEILASRIENSFKLLKYKLLNFFMYLVLFC